MFRRFKLWFDEEQDKDAQKERRMRRRWCSSPFSLLKTLCAIGAFEPDQLESIHRASMIILEQTGIEVNSLRARQFYKNAGAEVDEASQIVRLPQDLVISLLETAPSEFILTPTNSERALI